MKRKHLNFKIQTSQDAPMRRAICFKATACKEIKQLETSGQAVTLRNVKEVIPDNPNFAEVIFDDHSSIEGIAEGSMAFERTEPKLVPTKTVLEIKSQTWDDIIDNAVTVKGVLCTSQEVISRGGYNLLEGLFADNTGYMPISIWSNNIEPILKGEDKLFEIKNAAVKLHSNILTLTTSSNTQVSTSDLDDKHKEIRKQLKDVPLKERNIAEGKIQLIKDFTCGSRCTNCLKIVPHAITSTRFRCNPCSAIQEVTSISKKVTIGIDENQLILHSDNWNDCPFEEEALSDFLFGKLLKITYVVESKQIVKIEKTVNTKSDKMEVKPIEPLEVEKANIEPKAAEISKPVPPKTRNNKR